MKVYAIKRNDGKYKTEASEYLKEIWFAELFNDYETALCYCPNDCKIIECELMETTELADHDKKVRKQVCDEIRKALCMTNKNSICNTANCVYYDVLNEVLERIEKGE